MMHALTDAGYEDPTPIQAGLIPLAFDDWDVIGQARTGTGKTASFAIPILEMLEPSKEQPDPQALILVPTRELAVQVREEFAKLAKGQRISCAALYGGKPISGQIDKLRRGVQVVVGTPGRVLDHIGRRTLRLNGIWSVVLDEADRMLDIGFRPDIERILSQCPKDRQTVLLSATVPPPIQRLSRKYMCEPKQLDFSPTDIAVETIEQSYFTVNQDRKFDLLVKLMDREDPRQSIIFCRTRRGTERIFQRLSKRISGVSCIHGDMQQRMRDRVMAQFREGGVKHLVATDVVGRGIDVTTISHIVNFDIPEFCDDYIHRVGRAGRMGREGQAFTFVTPEEGTQLTRIEQRINVMLKRDEMRGFEAVGKISETPAAEVKKPPSSLSGRPSKRRRRGL